MDRLEFPTTEVTRARWAPEDYGAPKTLRQSVSVTNMILVEAV